MRCGHSVQRNDAMRQRGGTVMAIVRALHARTRRTFAGKCASAALLVP